MGRSINVVLQGLFTDLSTAFVGNSERAKGVIQLSVGVKPMGEDKRLS